MPYAHANNHRIKASEGRIFPRPQRSIDNAVRSKARDVF